MKKIKAYYTKLIKSTLVVFLTEIGMCTLLPLLLTGQSFYGIEMIANYRLETSDYEVILGIYREPGLDITMLQEIIHPGFGGPNEAITTGVSNVIEITPEVSLYQYKVFVNYTEGSQISSPFWGAPTPLPTMNNFANIPADCFIYLRPTLRLYGLGTPESNPTIAYWTPYLFDHYIDNEGVFHMNTNAIDDEYGATSFHGAMSIYGSDSDCNISGVLDSLLINESTGEILWHNPQPGTYLIGMDMIEWYGDYVSPLSRFPRYLVITIDEEDIVSTSSPITEAENRHLSLSPNPATNNCSIKTSQLEQPGKLTVNNLQGQVIYNETLPATSTITEIDVSTWPAGIYFVNLESEEGSITRKLVVTNDR